MRCDWKSGKFFGVRWPVGHKPVMEAIGANNVIFGTLADDACGQKKPREAKQSLDAVLPGRPFRLRLSIPACSSPCHAFHILSHSYVRQHS